MSIQDVAPSFPEQPSKQWREAYQSALQETDRRILFKRVEIAESAILTRRELLVNIGDGIAERRDIEAALDKISRVKKRVLKF